ncbi:MULTISPECIES: phosphatase PAP2 family protein [unclassified Legionella]|uniref:phosphatase PAP2 family protein n=1 Tax=unclassified Legionella TaxID=2622702 RepID=UPI001054C6A5|nr:MULTISPECIES: phosphatase PAP2 family protein [unclassified Legionella]MDI9819436.1 phosphatase PAP2 family protein [Legionella sp. PL877]
MQHPTKACTLITGLIILTLATIALAVNYFIFKFPGNNYFPPETPLIVTLLFLLFWGSYLQFGSQSRAVKITRELIYYFLVMATVAFATNAIQYTPFQPIDEKLIAMEAALGIDVGDILGWTVSYPWLTNLLIPIYDSLPYQMSLLPVVVIFMQRLGYVREYLCLLLLSALIGFSLYYFYPTLAPASFIDSPHFSQDQYATGIKFKEIRQHTPPSTMKGGMIAFPSFHAIWAWLCLYLVRWCPPLFIPLLPINLLLIASCVLLGWHYPIDLLGSLIVLLLAHGIHSYLANLSRDSTRVT